MVGLGPSMVEAQWSTVVGGVAVVDGQGSTLDAWRIVADGLFTESDRMDSNMKVTVRTVSFIVLWARGSQMA